MSYMCKWLLGIVYCLVAASSPARAQSGGHVIGADQAVALLEMFATQVQGNFERIRSASGSIEVVEMARSKDPVVPLATSAIPQPRPGMRIEVPAKKLAGTFFVKEEVRVRFAFDQAEDRLFTSYEQLGERSYENVQTGKVQTVRGIPKFHQQAVVTPEHYLHHMPNARVFQLEGAKELPVQAEHGHRVAYREASSEAERFQRQSFIVDPRDLFKYCNLYFFEHHQRGAQSLRAGQPTPMAVRQLPGEAKYAVEKTYFTDSRTRAGETRIRLVVDGAAGFHTSEATMQVKDGVHEQVSWKYQKSGSIYFPSDYRVRKYNAKGELTYERTFRIADLELNEPIPAETFTEHSFALADGDRFMDRIENKVALFQDGEPVSPEEFIRRQSEVVLPGWSSWPWIRWLVILVVAGVCVGCMIWAIWRNDGQGRTCKK